MSEPVTPINQEEINKAVWAACDTFRGTIDASMTRTSSLSCCS